MEFSKHMFFETDIQFSFDGTDSYKKKVGNFNQM